MVVWWCLSGLALVEVLAGLLVALVALVVVAAVGADDDARECGAGVLGNLPHKKKPTGLLHPMGSCSGSACAVAAYLEPTAFTSNLASAANTLLSWKRTVRCPHFKQGIFRFFTSSSTILVDGRLRRTRSSSFVSMSSSRAMPGLSDWFLMVFVTVWSRHRGLIFDDGPARVTVT